MTRVLFDAELRRRLGDLREPIELVDERGETVAIVGTPLAGYEPPMDDDELDNLKGEPGISTEELLARLRSR